jgi:hypothetical protein
VSAGFQVEHHRGRLIEARLTSLTTAEHVDAYAAAVTAKLEASRSHGAPVLCADHRAANIYPPVVADRLAQAFLPNNSRFDRIAILVAPENATLLMQLQRITRQAGSDKRRVCLNAKEAVEHLAKSLNAEELERARVFLSVR